MSVEQGNQIVNTEQLDNVINSINSVNSCEELQKIINSVLPDLISLKNAIEDQLKALAPVINLLEIPEPRLDAIIKWITKLKANLITPQLKALMTYIAQVSLLSTKMNELLTAITNKNAQLESCGILVAGGVIDLPELPSLEIPTFVLDVLSTSTLDAINSASDDMTNAEGILDSYAQPTNPDVGDIYMDILEQTWQWNGSEWVQINLESYLTEKSNIYLQYTTVYLYQWSSTTPEQPTGQSTYYWDTKTNYNYNGVNGWTIDVPTNPGIPGVYLWIAKKDISEALVNNSSIVYYNNDCEIINPTFTTESDGLRSAKAKIYKWDITIPSPPSGLSTFSWNNEGITDVPVGWSSSFSSSPSPGFSLWEASIIVYDSVIAETTQINWVTAEIGAISYAGTNGDQGIQGDSVDFIFQRSSTRPITPEQSYEIPSGWYTNVSDITETTGLIWSSFGIKATADGLYTWEEPIQVQGDDGNSYAECTIYKRSSIEITTPPTGGSYNFTTKNLTAPVGWSISIPTGTDPVYMCKSVAVIKGSIGEDSSLSWSIPYLVYKDLNVGVLSNESHTIPTDVNGNNGNYTGASSQMFIYQGETEITSEWNISASHSEGITGNFSDNNIFTVTNMTTDTGYVDFVATKSGYSYIIKRFSLSKSKQGIDSIVYSLQLSSVVLKKSISNVLTPSTVTVSGIKYDGNATPVSYAGRFKIYENGVIKYTSSVNESSKVYTPTSTATSILVELYSANGTTTKLDYQTVAIVGDGETGIQGDSVDIIFKRSATIPATPSPSSTTPTGWYTNVSLVPSGTDLMWSCFGKKTGDSSLYTWEVPLQIEGDVGDAGLSVAELTLFKRSTSVPASPTGGSYSFDTLAITAPSGWYSYIPTGTNPVYTSRSVASIQGTSGVDSTLSWSTPVLSFQNGADGIQGDSVDIIFKRSGTIPATPSPSSTTPSGWYTNVSEVPSGTDLMWSCFGKKTGDSSLYTWEVPLQIEGDVGADGADGADGISVAELTLFKRSTSVPSSPTGGSYSFDTLAITAPSGWYSYIPTGTNPVYTSRSVASIQGTSGVDSTLSWSTPVLSFKSGDDGIQGASYRACYARIINNPTPVAGTVTTSGSTSFPDTATHWGISNVTWSGSDPDPSSTYTLYVSDGIYDPATGNTVWSTPYQASLKVGSLSAITANLGEVNTGLMKNANFDTSGGIMVDLDNSQITLGDTVDGDYFTATSGDINFYRYINGAHRLAKSIKRLEAGTVNSGTTVTLPGYWKAPPLIMISPNETQFYNASYANQTQNIICKATNITETSTGSGIYTFYPLMQLLLASGNSSHILNYNVSDYSSIGGNTTSRTFNTASTNTPSNCTDITVNLSYYIWFSGQAGLRIRVYVVIDGAQYEVVNRYSANTERWSDGENWYSLITDTLEGDVTYNVNSLSPGVHSVYLKYLITIGSTGVYVSYDFNGTFKSYSTNLSEETVLANGSVNYLAIGE